MNAAFSDASVAFCECTAEVDSRSVARTAVTTERRPGPEAIRKVAGSPITIGRTARASEPRVRTWDGMSSVDNRTARALESPGEMPLRQVYGITPTVGCSIRHKLA